MNAQLNPTRFIPAMATSEGAGVTVHRTIGTPALRNYDPFLMLIISAVIILMSILRVSRLIHTVVSTLSPT